ncbi:hypothetical protein ACFE04_002791 [Oxalis oulophora]
MSSISLPDDFKCPISLEIMSDPVILPSGHTFDRSSIQRWLDSGHRSCPITKLPLPEHPCLIPNHALRSMISNYSPFSSSSISQQHTTNPDHNSQTHVAILISDVSPMSSKLESLCQLVKRSKLDSVFRRQLTESGVVSAVLNCVQSDDSVMQMKALSLLLNLSLDDDNKVGLVAQGAVNYVVAALKADYYSPDVRAVAATLITSLAVVDVNKATIGAYPNAIRNLVTLLRDGNGRGKKEAATALYTVCLFPNNRRKAVECGVVPILVAIADNFGMARAVEVLGVLVKCKEGREEMKRSNRCVEVLVKIVKEGSERGVQYALFTLNYLCCCSEEICMQVKRKGVLEICVVLLEDDNEKIRSNASNLVNTLRGD